jgi:heptosyltransferase-2
MTRSAEDNKHARAGQREDAKHAPAAGIRRAARLLRLRRGRNIRRVSPVVDPSKIERIWIRVPNWLGDFVMATASFERIRAAFPRAHITAGMRPYLRLMAHGSDTFDEIVETPKGGGLRALWRQVREMRARRFDLAIVLPNSPSTGLVPRLAGVPLRLGYRQGRPGMMNLGLTAQVGRRWWQKRAGPRRRPIPMPHYYRDLLDVLGIPPGGTHPRLAVTDDDDEWVTQHLVGLGVPADQPLLLLVVGANYGASKLWMPERFAAVSRHFQQRHGMRALVLVGPAEVELGERIAAEGDAIAMTRPVLPLNRLKALVRRAALMITGDTGPRHLGNAFDLPIVCMMGPNDPNYTDYCMERTALIRKDLACMPCQLKVCPLGHQRCMKDITVAEVASAGERLLGL